MEAVANGREILVFLTELMRGEIEPGRERLRAAELLGKRFNLFEEEDKENGGVVFIEGGNELK